MRLRDKETTKNERSRGFGGFQELPLDIQFDIFLKMMKREFDNTKDPEELKRKVDVLNKILEKHRARERDESR